MKILLLNNFHYRRGGSEAAYFNLGRLLESRGHEVMWFSFADPANEPCPQSAYFPPRPANALEGAFSYFWNRRAARALERLLQAEKPDLAHVHLIWGGLSPSVLRVLRRHRIPVVHTAHDYRLVCPGYIFRDGAGKVCERCRRGHYLPCLKHRCAKGSLPQSLLMTLEMYTRQLFHNPLRLIDGFIFVSRFARERHLAHDRHFANARSAVIYNAMPMPQHPAQTPGDEYLYFGRLSREKGVDTLIDAFLRLPDLHLKVVGTGPLEDALRAKVAAAGASNISFCGYMNWSQLQPVIAASRFVMVPSEWYENNPLTVIEAYAAGRPVIGARIGGIPEIVPDGETGYLFPSGETDALCEVLRRAAALTDEQYAGLSRAAFSFFREHFNEEKACLAVEAFYREVLG